MASLFEKGIQGLADTKWSGVAGSCAKLIGIDYRSKPGVFTAHQKMTKDSPDSPDVDEVDELCKVPLAVSDGSNLWFSSESGKIWREVDGVYTLVYTLDPITDFDQYAAFNEAFPDSGDTATIWKTFNTDPLINYSTGFILKPSGDDAPKVTSRDLNRAASNSATLATSITIPDRPNQIVIAITGNYDTDGGSHGVSGITFDGNAMTSMGSGTGTSGGFHIAWGMARYMNPSVGSFQVETTFASASENRFLYVIVFEGVDQTTPIIDTDNGFGEDSPSLATLDLVGTANNQVLVMATFTPEAVHIMGTGQTEIINSNADATPPEFDESVSMKVLRVGDPIVLGAAELTGSVDNVIDNFDPEDNEPDLSEDVNMVYFASSDILWKIPVSELDDWTGNVATVGVFQNGNPSYHPMVVQNLQLFIGDGNLVAKVNELNQFIPETELNVEKNEVITTMVGFDIDVLIGTKDVNQCRVIRWDTVSESWSAEDEIDDTEVYAFIRDDNFVYALVGEAGRLYFYNGEKLVPYQRIPGTWSPTSTGKINANAVGFILGIPVFGFSNITGNPTEQGIYGFGSYSKDYPKTLSLDFPISTDEFSGVEIGAIITRGSNMWAAWKSGTDVGVDKLDYTAKYEDAHLETVVLSPMKNRSEYKTLVRVHAPYASLPESTAVVLTYSKNYASYLALSSVVDALHSIVKSDKTIPKVGNIQLRLGLTVSGNNAPELEDLQVDLVAETTQTG